MLKRLNYLWRLGATGFSFFIFGLGGLLFGGLLIPLTLLWPGVTRAVAQPKKTNESVNAKINFFTRAP